MIKAHLKPIVRRFFNRIVPSRAICPCIGNQDDGLVPDLGRFFQQEVFIELHQKFTFKVINLTLQVLRDETIFQIDL